MKTAIGVLYTLLPEIILLILAALLASQAAALPHAGQLAAQSTAAVILLVALGLALQFNRSRMFFALLSMLLAYGGWLLLLQTTDPLVRMTLSGALSLLLPLDLVVFSCIPERGMFTRYGALWFGLLTLQTLFVLGIIGSSAQALGLALHVEFVHLALLRSMPITQPGLLTMALGLLWLNDRLLRRHSAELAAFFLALLVAGPLQYATQPALLAVFTAAAGLAFGYAVIQESWSMAYLDELTGLPGRRALEEHMRQLGGHYVIAMVDVDHFKRFNDTYGHDVGDQVLRFMAAQLHRHAAGKPFRYGGEEFSLVFAGRSLTEVRAELEQLRADIENSRFDLRRGGRRDRDTAATAAEVEEMLAITVSIGVAECGEQLSEPWTVLKAADKALYAAKHAGRNRVSLSGV